MSVWPEERLRSEVESAGGELSVPVESLLAHFGLVRLTDVGRRDLDEWLEDAGLRAEPPLVVADGAPEVTLRVLADAPPARQYVVPPPPERRPAAGPARPRPSHRPRPRPRLDLAATTARMQLRRSVRLNTAGMALLAAVGVLAVTWGVVTLAWKEPWSAFTTARQQRHLEHELADLEGTRLSLAAAQERQLARIKNVRLRRKRRMFFFARALHTVVPTGGALGRLEIPKLGVEKVMVEGADNVTIRKGPGHYGNTLLPGQGGTIGIAGHRTTYGAPFRNLDQLHKGNRIVLEMPYGVFTYRVTGTRIYDAGETDVFGHRPGRERLVLSACHPVYSAAQRIVVFARLTKARPVGPALREGRARPVVDELGRRLLRAGMQGRDVAGLQRLLGVTADGVFGPGTEAAVKSFQTLNGLRATGVVGPRTRVRLINRGTNARRDAAAAANLPPTPPAPPPEPRPDQRNRNGQQQNGDGQQQSG
jgi:sortase A